MGNKKVVIFLLFVGAILILISFSMGNEKAKETSANAFDLATYKTTLEGEVKELCASVRDVGDVTVSLYFETGEEYVYASDKTASGGKDYVLSSGDGLLLSVKLPPVSGVSVVCEGGDDKAVQKTLTDLLTSLFGIGANRVHIAAKK